MIAKGNLHGQGGKLAVYLITGKESERAELVELRGFASSDIRTAFRDIEIQAAGTHCAKPFFHAYTRLRTWQIPASGSSRESFAHSCVTMSDLRWREGTRRGAHP